MARVQFKMAPSAERELLRRTRREVERRGQQLLDQLRERYRGAERSEIRAALKQHGIVGRDGKPSEELVDAIHRGAIIKPDMSHWG